MSGVGAGERALRPAAPGINTAARERMLARRGEPLFVAAWERVLMIHFEVDAEGLQRDVPFPLDLWNGRAFVSLVAFTMRGMRPRLGGEAAALVFRPIATHEFLNLRTYVRCGKESGIHFLAEWLPNRLAVMLGPAAFGLPYRFGRIDYEHDWRGGAIHGQVSEVQGGRQLVYQAGLPSPASFHLCEAGSLDEWLMERYTAFNAAGGRRRFFRVWHPPWSQAAANAKVQENSLLTEQWPWFDHAELAGANFATGFEEVWMGRPHRLPRPSHN